MEDAHRSGEYRESENPIEQLITQMAHLTKTLSDYGQETSQLTSTVDKMVRGGSYAMSGSGRAKISVKLPLYSGEPDENIYLWCKQLQVIFMTQRVEDEELQIYYASTAMEGAALHWFLNNHIGMEDEKLRWTSWDSFQQAITEAFQPPRYQKHLRMQLRKLRQTGTALEYVTKFHSIIEQVEDMSEMDKIMHFLDGLKPVT